MGLIIHLTIGQLLSAGRGADDPAITDHLRTCVQCQRAAAQANETLHPTPGDLAAFVSGDMAPADKEKVAAHLADCGFCRAAEQEITREPRPVSTWAEQGRRRSTPAFFGVYIALPIGEGVLGFLDDRVRQQLVAAARRHFEQQKKLLSSILGQLNELEASVAPPAVSYLMEGDLSRQPEEEYWQQEIVPQQRAADALFHELRTKFEVIEKNVEITMMRWAHRPGSATPTLELTLGSAMQVVIRAGFKDHDLQLTLDARWPSGTPGRNVEVRAISREREMIQSSRTDHSGRAELQLETARYKIELEHDVHGAGALILDVSVGQATLKPSAL